ncbi:MAG: flagellar hook-associated family protein [Salinarimonadaceae bacterium]|nr:MAG: flagellar hook-associated family protein [Salinarimonadaceae bacterium]
MKTTFISTQAIADSTRLSMIRMQSDLAKASKELSSGRLADVGLGLGSRTGHAVQLRQELTQITTIIDTNGLVKSRLSTSQAAMASLLGTAEDFMATLVTVRDGTSAGDVIKPQAMLNLKGLIGTLNANMNGQFLFSGINTDVRPLADYEDDPPSAAKTSIDGAFIGAFGVAQDDPAASAITGADMKAFLDGAFETLFDDANWAADWSDASSRNIRSRISTNELIETSANANEPAFRKLAMAYSMIGDLGLENLDRGAAREVVDKAIGLVAEALQGLTSAKARLGVAQNRVANADERLAIQRDILMQQITGLENVDLYETSTRVNTLMTQVELSYNLTARIRQLSLLKFM